MAGLIEAGTYRLVSQDGFTEKDLEIDNSGNLYFDGKVFNDTFMILALSDEETPITNGASKITFRSPYPILLTKEPRAFLTSASTVGDVTVDINKNGTSILSTVISLDVTKKSSLDSINQPVLATTSIADDDEITLDIDTAGTDAKGLKVTIYYRRV